MLEYNKLFETMLYYLILISNYISKFSIIKYFSREKFFNDEEKNINNKIYKIRIYKYKEKYYRTERIDIYRIDDVKFLNDDEPITF